MKNTIAKYIQKYHFTPFKIVLIVLILLLVFVKIFVPNYLIISLIRYVFDLYGNFLMSQSKLFLIFSNGDFVFDFVKNQIITQGHILKINRFYFSLNQIVAVLAVVLLSKSSILNKVKYFIVAFLIISLYNSLRITLHAIYPDTATVHNWFFNLLLIPRWLIVLGFVWYYWKKFPTLLEFIKKKFGFNDEFIKSTFLKIAIIIVIYYLVVILTFNDLIFLNGSLLISFILKTSKYFIELLGYECWLNNRLIYGTRVSLYMDDSCMGINLMFLFASFIALMPGSFKHKLWYIPMGLIIIVLLNSLRVILIFVNISKAGSYIRY
jgi:hypothetical protein